MMRSLEVPGSQICQHSRVHPLNCYQIVVLYGPLVLDSQHCEQLGRILQKCLGHLLEEHCHKSLASHRCTLRIRRWR